VRGEGSLERLKFSQPKVSALANYRLDGFSVERLMTFLSALDLDVEIAVRAKPRGQAAGRISVVAASVRAVRHRARVNAFPTGSILIASLCPVAAAYFSSVRVLGRMRPLSSRDTALSVVPMRVATSACVSLERERARMSVSTSWNSSSSAA
jgi:hypothetical protein